jgi:hypothetical protein
METPTSLTDNSPTIPDVANKRPKVEWSPENEKILVEWCDIAQCYKWLNSRAHSKYSRLHAWFTIPAIILSTISGTASFAQESIPLGLRSYATMSVGTINIAVGILATIQQYLKISELNESYRVSSIAWDKYARNIRIELAKAPSERPDAGIFIKHNRDEFDRLMETSPSISAAIISDFMSTFANSKDPTRKKQFAVLKKPDICDIIVSAEENRHHWYKELEMHSIASEPTDLEVRVEQDIIKRQEELRKREEDIRDIERNLTEKTKDAARARLLQAAEEERKSASARATILDFVKLFETSHGRNPISEEIHEQLGDRIERKYINQYVTESLLNFV